MENVKDRIVLGEDSKNHFKEKIHNQEQLAKEITAFALLVNALVHRDYSILSSIRIFIFKDRIEIISSGVLPNHLNEENIRLGISIARNPILLRYASRLMPYRGVGSGILRALSKYSKIDFENNQLKYEFKVTIWRGN